jgi:branched-subunit amino acid ABC-type transport system permease component
MTQIILFAILGIGGGAAYALTGLGLVVIYKGSGILNLAQGAVAMFAAFCFTSLANQGISAPLAAVISILGAGAGGALLYWMIIGPIRHYSPLAQTVATVGLLVTLDALALLLWSNEVNEGQIAPSLLPANTFRIFGATVGVNRLWLLAIAAALVLILHVLYTRTRFGIATRAAAESERSASLLGYAPAVIAAWNWALGFALAALAGILIAPISALDINALTFMVIPALAAALVGRLSNFTVTACAAVLIGIGESFVTRYVSLTGGSTLISLAIILLAVAVAGRRIPSRGTLASPRAPRAASGRASIPAMVILPAAIGIALLVVDARYQAAITTSLIGVMISLSLVVVTGFVGQINLAPLSFAAIAAFGTSVLSYNAHVPFPFPILIGAVMAVPVGLVIGLPALRVRGLHLAIVTLSLGVSISAAFFGNNTIAGGANGRPVTSPALFGLSLDSASHPAAFGIFTLVVTCLLALGVSNLRKGATGRRMLAVRGNERAAAAAGVNVAGLKLTAFAISAFIAGVAGGVLAYEFDATASNSFTPALSLSAFAVAFIGGIASVSGAFYAGLLVSGGLMYVILNNIPGIGSYWALITGVLLIVTIVTQPDGIAIKNLEMANALREKLGIRRGRATILADQSNSPIPSEVS